MNFSQRQRDTRRGAVRFGLVVLFHAAVVHVLATGLGKTVVDVVRAPLETKVIEEMKKPPPPPEIAVPAPPRLEAPPPPFIPPPEVQVATPPPPEPTITAVTPTPPPAPLTIAPEPPVVAAPPAPLPPAAKAGIEAVCTKVVKPEVPGLSVQGRATISVRYTIQGGQVTQIDVVRYAFPGVNDRKVQRALVGAIEEAARRYVCPGDHAAVQQEFVFNIQ